MPNPPKNLQSKNPQAPLDKQPPVKKTERRALLWDILKKLAVFAAPYKRLIIATLGNPP